MQHDFKDNTTQLPTMPVALYTAFREQRIIFINIKIQSNILKVTPKQLSDYSEAHRMTFTTGSKTLATDEGTSKKLDL